MGRTCKLHTEKPQVGIEPGALWLQGNGANHHTTVQPKNKTKCSKMFIHITGNDTRWSSGCLNHLKTTKIDVASVCNFAKGQFTVFSGPLPSRLSSFNCWLPRWCPANNVGYIDNWQSFWGKPGLIRKDGIHPTLEGAALICRNMAEFISHPKTGQPRVETRMQSGNNIYLNSQIFYLS